MSTSRSFTQHSHIYKHILWWSCNIFLPRVREKGMRVWSFGYMLCSAALSSGEQNCAKHRPSLAFGTNSRGKAGGMWLRRGFRHLIGIVVSGVVEVVADGRGQHDEQVDALHLVPQVRQPDQTVHLRNGITLLRMYLFNKNNKKFLCCFGLLLFLAFSSELEFNNNLFCF